MKLILSILVLVLLSSVLFPSVVWAQVGDPDTLRIEEVQAFRHIAEANDTLYVLRYNIDWANSTQPFEAVDLTFRFILYDDAGVVVGNKTAYPFHNDGYNQGIVSFYFAGNSTNPSWGELGNVTIIGTNLFAAPVPSVTYVLVAGDYSIYTAPSDIREDLRQFLISQVQFLDFSWNDYWIGEGTEKRETDLLVYLLDQRSYAFSNTGEAYMLEAIPNLDSYVPQLFMVILAPLTYDDKTHTRTAISQYQEQFDGTPIEEFKIAMAGWMGDIGSTTAFSMLIVLFIVGNMMFTGMKWNNIHAGLMISLAPIWIMARMGLPDLGLMFMASAMVIIAAFFLVLLKPSQG